MNTYLKIKNSLYGYATKLTLVVLFALNCTIITPMHNGSEQKTESNKYALLEKFTQKYAPPKEVCEIIEKNKETILNIDKCGQIKELPNYFIKTIMQSTPWIDCEFILSRIIGRLINAERMHECIKRNNLTLLDVTKKYLYNINGHWIIVAEKVTPRENKPITLAELQQIYALIKETGYLDWHTENWYRSDNKLICIDTENLSFSKNKTSCLRRLISNIAMFPEAYKWITTQNIKTDNKIKSVSLTRSTKFDDPEMNFEEVKFQLRQQHVETLKLRSKL